MRLRLSVIAAVMATLASGAVQATPLSASFIMANYNLITSGNATTNSDIEGSAVIGGNFSGATVFGNSSRQPAHPELDVYGTLSGNLNNNCGLVDYHNKTGNINLNNGGTQRQDNFTHLLTDFIDPLNQLSASLAGLTANSTITTGGGKAIFNASPVGGMAVFSLTATQLQNALNNNAINFVQNGATAIIINVTGNFTDPASSNWNPPAQQDVLFNFIDATQATVSVRNWEGSILAPNATLSISGGNIEGFVYAASFNGGGELHNIPFTGRIPEPGSVALLSMGLLGIGVLKQRRRL
jgi:choice-of-anchor A domain-containing protein